MGALTVAVTGAGGFLGRHAVAEARARGHRVVAILRGEPPEAWDGVEVRRLDLANPAAPVASALGDADAVIHAAAALEGDDARHARDTLAATAAVLRARPRRLVLAGSMAVYAGGRAGGAITEASPLEPHPAARDAYARAKLAQERLARGAGVPELWVLRIGALWGPGRLWNGHLGARAGPLLLRVGSGPIPLAHVEHAALACLLAAERPGGGTVNVVDDDLPDVRRFLRALGAAAVPVPWRALDLAGALRPGRGLLSRPSLRARMMPRRYPNGPLHALGWSPRLSFEEGMARARGVS